ncbi:MAG TPA: flagellar biosynthetic protein FliR, partial [Stellaceae bacterium]|nr:flagellar biosynthetic protein FliR [Stellaceae bacterium]
ALPHVLGVALPVRVQILLSALVAAALMPLATIALPSVRGVLPVAILVGRELAIGVVLAFTTAIVSGALMSAGDLIGAGMQLNVGAILRGSALMPSVLADGFAAIAGMLFFVAGLQRWLFLALARSLVVAPLGTLAAPPAANLLILGGHLFALALELALPVAVPLFVLALAKGVIARFAPQVNLLAAAPAAMVTAGLILLALDASGLINGMMRLWLAFTAEATRSLLG